MPVTTFQTELQISSTDSKAQNGSKAKDPFLHISDKDKLKSVIEILRSRIPRAGHVFNFASTLDRFPGSKLFTLNGDISVNCIVVITYWREDYGNDINISLPFPCAITNEIREAFITSNIFDWDKPYIFNGLDRQLSPTIAEISTLVKGNATQVNPYYYYYLAMEEAIKIEIPEIPSGTELRSLDIDQGARFILDNWKYTRKGTKEYVDACISENPSSGIYVDGECAAGIITHCAGLLGMLFTTQKHRNKGLAQVCAKDLMRKLAKSDLVPTSCVEQKNEASNAFHFKIGMKRLEEVDYVFYLGSKW